jgi:hypothetical protein
MTGRTTMKSSTDFVNKFWSRVVVDEASCCWIWIGSKSKEGYGNFCGRLTHVLSWELAHAKPSPTDGHKLEFDHLCRNPSCVNPTHLEVVTRRINNLRGETIAAKNARKTSCPKGHPYDGHNLMRAGKYKTRRCRTCDYKRNRIRMDNNVKRGLRTDGLPRKKKEVQP